MKWSQVDGKQLRLVLEEKAAQELRAQRVREWEVHKSAGVLFYPFCSESDKLTNPEGIFFFFSFLARFCLSLRLRGEISPRIETKRDILERIYRSFEE